MSRNWTKEQLEAIDKEGTNIIVSAGAGSGKTAVLTERVIRKLRKGINIDQLLVLTFTKAAAHEMKERIRNELKNDETLKEQLSHLDASYITTFDSFALSIVKKYHYILNISPNVSICDSNILKMEKAKIIDQLFDELYEKENLHFLKLISDFCVKDDQNIKNYLLKINEKLDMRYDRDTYLENYVDTFLNDFKIDADINQFTNIIKERCEQIKRLLSNIGEYVETEYYEALERVLDPLLQSTTYHEYKNNLNIELPRLPRNGDEVVKGYRDAINDVIKELHDICVWDDEKEIKHSVYATKDYIVAITSIIKELNKRLKQYKYEHDLYEFVDIANLSIKLIKEHQHIRDELKNSFHEILVDEYQDTNDLQEEFISSIGNHNVYMVGDIKQSIYRFRNANPEIFKQTYEKFKHNDEGFKIDLNKNFRSRGEVLNNINFIFDDIMDTTLGGADYKLEHRLELGNILYDNEGKTNQNNNLEIYNYPYDKKLGFKREEIEISLIAKDIKHKMDNHYQVFDNNTKKLRDVKYSDFAILLDRSNNFDLYKKIFTFMKIPLMVHKDESIAITSDILVIKSILKLILYLKTNNFDNDFKYAFMSVGRSFLFDYNDNDLFELIINNTYQNTMLFEKASKLSKLTSSLSIDALLDLVMKEFNIIPNLIKIGNVGDMTIRLESLIDNAKVLASMGYNLESFISYLDKNFNMSSDIKISTIGEASDACHIMTIHKSKGLEYTICYYSGLSSQFNIGDLKELFYYDSIYGIITPYFSEGICNTIYKYLLKEKYLKEEIEEKIRLFYVALTRCKEKMIIVTDLNTEELSYNRDAKGLIDYSARLGYRSFRDILLSVKDKLMPFVTNMEIDEDVLNNDYNLGEINDYIKLIPLSNIVFEKKEIKIDSKIINEASYSKKVNSILDKETYDAIQIGKQIHAYLENLDFKQVNIDSINSPYKNKVIAFLKQDILSNVEQAKIYKEYEFIYLDDDIEHHGIIDLMLEFDDHIKIIDYKFKDIDKDEYDKQLKGYKQYIESTSDKKVDLYLYSIIDERYRKVL